MCKNITVKGLEEIQTQRLNNKQSNITCYQKKKKNGQNNVKSESMIWKHLTIETVFDK